METNNITSILYDLNQIYCHDGEYKDDELAGYTAYKYFHVEENFEEFKRLNLSKIELITIKFITNET